MIRFCCNRLAEEYQRTVFGLIPRLELNFIDHDSNTTYNAKIFYCPFCGTKLQGLGPTIQELKDKVNK